MRQSFPTATARHVLVVADWSIDTQRVVTELARRRADGDANVSLVVPAWLHGIDWVGDPTASVPCAERQLKRLVCLATDVGLTVLHATVGDPDPLTAIDDACSAVRADEILLFVRDRRRPSLRGFLLAAHARRATGLPVQPIAVAPAERRLPLHAWLHVGAGHCAAHAAEAS